MLIFGDIESEVDAAKALFARSRFMSNEPFRYITPKIGSNPKVVYLI
jgi:hypothetical protein